MSSKKVMPRIEYQRLGDHAVITQVWPDGTRQQLTLPIDQALILCDWIAESAEDHEQAVAPEPHPSPAPEPETGEAGGCTRTGSFHKAAADLIQAMADINATPMVSTTARRGPRISVAFPANCDQCNRVGVYGTVCRCGFGLHVNRDHGGPVSAIADGEVRRA